MSRHASLGCPPWCVVAHDPGRGEEDWLHESAPVLLTDGVSARTCLSVDPLTGVRDGPYVIVGEDELSPAEAVRLGEELSLLGLLDPRPGGPGAAA